MDYRTGIVGIKRRISYKGLSEVMEVHPEQRSTEPPYRPTTDEVRAALAMLERAGLVVQLPKANKFDPIVFRLPLADVDSIRPNEEPQMNPKGSTPNEPQGENAETARVLWDSDRGRTPNEPQGVNPIHPVSGKYPPPETRAGVQEYGAEKFAMFHSWAPSSEFEKCMAMYGVRRAQFTDEEYRLLLAEFVLHWVADGDELTQGGWEHKWVKNLISFRNHQSKRGGSHAGTSTSSSWGGDLSATERTSREVDEYLANLRGNRYDA